ncbi:DUF3006 domain-containing protein [Haloarchaeobius iranensis]|uniref:DUF3006 family protein n=1 Tax=Haloarchaeobius iranensis TaxID=996166 RepID=A0A1H0B3T2_9EURY|nr:DUF3006 domain-containing protein [Haloarchaeobius iranensis]SDN40308.1 Protein of unknown function [Haloarchaeobius iranensis]
MPETYTAVLDRFEESTAVLLLEQDGEQVEEMNVARDMLPRAGRHQDAIFELEISDETVSLRYREQDTEQRRTDAQSRFDRLSTELPDERSGTE